MVRKARSAGGTVPVVAAVVAVFAAVLPVTPAAALPVDAVDAAAARRPATGTGPGTPAPFDPVEIARRHVREQAAGAEGLAAADVADLAVTDVVPSPHLGVTHVYLQQRRFGIDIVGANVNVAVRDDGTVAGVGSRLVGGVASLAADTVPVTPIDAPEAAAEAARGLGLEVRAPFRVTLPPRGADRDQTLRDGGVVDGPIPARLVYQPIHRGPARLAWELLLDVEGGELWQVRIDAQTGEELDRYDFVVEDDFGHPASEGGDVHGHEVARPGDDDAQVGGGESSAGGPSVGARPPARRSSSAANLVADGSSYRVFASPAEAPTFTGSPPPADGRTLVSEPADATASPFGWHDTNGAAGPEFTRTEGNNVHAYTDLDDSDDPTGPGEVQPDGGPGLYFDFDFPINLRTDEPSTYRGAAVTNLFYWSNIAHDLLYAYGFDEAAGNFQVNNYGNGGAGGDAVQAEAQDGGGINNANFQTPPDGTAPRMQMYLWNTDTPQIDGDFDAGVILHEYGHGLSNRLTGGPSNSNCLRNDEQAGEGWSDFVALLGTMRSGDIGSAGRGIGTYVLNQLTTGPGIREYRYDTDLADDPRTYDDIKNDWIPGPPFGAVSPHRVGSTFAAMLWDLTWALIDEYGFDADLAHGTGGNNLAMQLVVDGLKLQPCSPGFVDARDAILLADELLTGGVNGCLIWGAFAKRGLGFGADQGSPFSIFDGTESAPGALPPQCDALAVDITTSFANVGPGDEIHYTLVVTNNDVAQQTGVAVTVPIPTGTTFVASSATCGGSLVGPDLVFALGTLGAGASTACTFRLLADPSLTAGSVVFSDGFESGFGAWTLASSAPAGNWVTVPNQFAGGSAANAAGTDNGSVGTTQDLTTASAVLLPAAAELTFQHRYVLEYDLYNGAGTPENPDRGFDGGVVEISVDGGTTWTDLGPQMIERGYVRQLYGAGPPANSDNPLAGRMAFSGDAPFCTPLSSCPYHRTTVDLSPFAGQSAQFRFRLSADSAVAGPPNWPGWFVDDVEVAGVPRITTTAQATSAQHPGPTTTSTRVSVVATVPGAPTGITATPGNAQLAVNWTAPAATGGAAITDYLVEYSSNAGATWTVFNDGVTPATNTTITGLTNGTAYIVRISATNPAGTGPPSTPSAAATPRTVPGAPTGVTATAGNAQLTVNWTAPASNGGAAISDYRIEYSSNAGATWTVFNDGTSTTTNTTITGLTNGTAYIVRISATNPAGTGPPSTPSAATVPRSIPGAPTGVTATAGNAQLTVNWTAPASNGGAAITDYRIEHSTNGGTTWTVFNDGVTPATNTTITGLTNGTSYIVRVSAINTAGTGPPSTPSAAATPQAPLPPTVWVPLTPARLLETRVGFPSADGQFAGLGKRAAQSTTVVQIAGRGGVPSDAIGVIVNVTAVEPEANGFVTVEPCGPSRPTASSLNYTTGVNLGNEIVAQLDAAGRICIYTHRAAHLTADVVGYIPAGSPLVSVTPARALETRIGEPSADGQFQGIGKRSAGSTLRLDIAGRVSVPAGAGAVVVNVTAVNAQQNGFIVVYACLASRPTASSLNYVAGVNRGNEIVAQLDASGDLCIYTHRALDITVDVVAYLPAGTDVQPVAPARILETRPTEPTIDGQSQGAGTVPKGSITKVRVAGRAGVPPGARTVIVNVTAVNPLANGFITVFTCPVARPEASNLNFRAGVNGGNDLITGIDANGDICIYNHQATDITADVTGYTTR